MKYLSALAVPLALLAAGCALEMDEVGEESNEVVRGIPVIDYPSAGALLRGNTRESSAMQCSGTLVGCDTFITAAHCVCDDVFTCNDPIPPSQLSVYFQHAGIYDVASVAAVPGYQFPEFGDLAVVRLAEPVVGIEPAPINDINPATNAALKIVGFGLTSKALATPDFGIKREGDLIRESCENFSDQTMLCFDPDISPTVSCSGDSGGPNYIDIGGTLHLAGVVSGGGSQDSCVSSQKFATNVSGYLDFIRANAGELGGSCGDIPDVEDPTALVMTGSGFEASREYLFDVPPGTAEVRFAANAILGDHVNVVAGLGATPDPVINDCAGNGRMASSCTVLSPKAGTWHVLVTSDTEHQVTVSALPGAPSAAPDAYEAVSGDILEIGADEGLLINDEGGRGGSLRAEVVSQPANGVVLIQSDGSFQYQSAEGFLGIDTFTYRAVEDPYGAETEVTVEVVEEAGCGCAAGSPRSAGGGLLLMGLALLAIRRRRSR